MYVIKLIVEKLQKKIILRTFCTVLFVIKHVFKTFFYQGLKTRGIRESYRVN